MLKRFIQLLSEATRRYFVAGLLLMAPIGITVWAVLWAVRKLDNLFLPHLMKFIPGVDPSVSPDLPPLIGFVFTFMAILLIGVLARDVLGHEIIRAWERLFSKVPIGGRIYGAVRQLFEAVINSGDQGNFRRVVLLEYPRKGIWAIAFVSSPTDDSINHYLPEPMLNCFLPTTPNPTSGFYLLVPETEIIDVDFTVEEAFKIIMSAGLVAPPANGTGASQGNGAPGAAPVSGQE